MPRITNINPKTSTCSDSLRVKGPNFGDKACTNHVAIGGHGAHVDATLVSWSNIGITVRIPKSDKLKPGNRYYVGVSAEGDTKWLSNIDQTFRLQARP
jgi:hypothetical protein